MPLPDKIARRREHTQGRFVCARAGMQCLSAAAAEANRVKWAGWSMEKDLADAAEHARLL